MISLFVFFIFPIWCFISSVFIFYVVMTTSIPSSWHVRLHLIGYELVEGDGNMLLHLPGLHCRLLTLNLHTLGIEHQCIDVRSILFHPFRLSLLPYFCCMVLPLVATHSWEQSTSWEVGDDENNNLPATSLRLAEYNSPPLFTLRQRSSTMAATFPFVKVDDDDAWEGLNGRCDTMVMPHGMIEATKIGDHERYL